jgi:hypothetical protein
LRNEFLYFDRHNPKPAIDEAHRKIAYAKDAPTRNALAWVLAGIGIIAVIAALSRKE